MFRKPGEQDSAKDCNQRDDQRECLSAARDTLRYERYRDACKERCDSSDVLRAAPQERVAQRIGDPQPPLEPDSKSPCAE